MNRILVNALSVTTQSALHVLGGHLDRLCDWLADACRFVVIRREKMKDFTSRLQGRVDWVNAPQYTTHWFPRALWEARNLQGLARALDAKTYFTPSGIASSALRIPQVVLCQNPWALVPSARGAVDAPKAWLQRLAYRTAMRKADVMVFNSRFMQEAYRHNAGFRERRGIIAYQAADEASHRRAEEWADCPRTPGQIVCVSAMARHKNIEALIHAFGELLSGGLSDASLRLVGAWPDAGYEAEIRSEVAALELGEKVHFDGFLSREELDRTYAESQVFCLMSRCESFGIPAIEAQLFGTPIVCSNVCAVPEICGNGGLFCDPDDIPGIVNALHSLLTDSERWAAFSVAARQNAGTYRWNTCSQPLADVFSEERV